MWYDEIGVYAQNKDTILGLVVNNTIGRTYVIVYNLFAAHGIMIMMKLEMIIFVNSDIGR